MNHFNSEWHSFPRLAGMPEVVTPARQGIAPSRSPGLLCQPTPLTEDLAQGRFVKLAFPITSVCLPTAEEGLHGRLPLPPLTPEQQDDLACQQARLAVAAATYQSCRPEHLRFQNLWGLAQRLQTELDAPGLFIHLNPIRARAHVVTPRFVPEKTELPADLLFFPVQDGIAGAVLSPKAHSLVNALGSFGCCTVDQFWFLNKHSGRKEIVQFCRELARVGLVAFS